MNRAQLGITWNATLPPEWQDSSQFGHHQNDRTLLEKLNWGVCHQLCFVFCFLFVVDVVYFVTRILRYALHSSQTPGGLTRLDCVTTLHLGLGHVFTYAR